MENDVTGRPNEVDVDAPVVSTQGEKTRKRRNVFSYVALLPAALLVFGLMVFPIGETIYHSFTNWDGATSTFIGFENFRLIFSNPIISQVLINSLIFLISVPQIPQNAISTRTSWAPSAGMGKDSTGTVPSPR